MRPISRAALNIVFMKDKIIKIINLGLTVLIILVVLFILGSRLPIPGNYQLLVVRSGSMEPAISTGDIVVVKPQDSYGEGDVITFRSGSDSVTHRIIAVENGRYVTKGDANDSADIRPVPFRQVQGQVLFNLPWLGYLVAASQEPLGFLFLIIVPALYIIVSESVKVVKEVRGKKSEVRIRNKE